MDPVPFIFTFKVPFIFTFKVPFIFTFMVPFIFTFKVPFIFTFKVPFIFTFKVPFIFTFKVPFIFTSVFVQYPRRLKHLILIILKIHILVSYDQNISQIIFVKMDSMSGCDIRLVFTFPPKDSTLQYKMRTPLK